MHSRGHTSLQMAASGCSARWSVFIMLLICVVTYAHASRYVYDSNGRVVGVVNDAGQAAGYRYDAVGNLVSVAAPASGPMVFTLEPQRGAPGTLVRAVGHALPTQSGQQVLFGAATAANITAADASHIEFQVPAVASGIHALTLTTASGNLALGSFEVISTLAPPTIASISQSCAKYDAVVSVTGTGFDTRPDATRVEVGGRLARITAITASTLSFRAPLHTPGGPVRVITEAGSAQSSAVLYLFAATGDPCASLTAGGMLQIDGGPVNVQFSAANQVLEYAFYAERGQWLSVFFANPSLADFRAEAAVLAPEGRYHPLVDASGNKFETQNLRVAALSLHMMPVERTGFHVLRLKLTMGAGLGLDMRIANLPQVQKGSTLSLQAAPGQWMRMLYLAQAGDQLGVGLNAQNSTPETMFSSIYSYTTDHLLVTPEIGSSAGCSEGGNCSLNLKTYQSEGVFPFAWYPQSSESVAQASVWFSDDRRPLLEPNVPQAFAISRIGQNARFPIYAEAGSGFSINIRNVSLSLPDGSVSFWLYAPDGTRITSRLTYVGNTGYFTATGAMISVFQLPMTGIYTAVLDPSGGGLASGQIELDPGQQLVVDGPELSIANTGAGKANRFVIQGSAGQKLGVGLKNIQLAPNSPEPWLRARVHLPGGEEIVGTSGSSMTTCYPNSPGFPGCEFDLGPLPYSGAYAIVIEGSAGLTSASYQIQATSDAEVLLTDSLQPVAISRYGGNARINFNAGPGAAQTIELQPTQPPTTGQQLLLSILRPDGFPLTAPLYTAGQSSGNGSATVRIGDFPIAGVYTLFVDPAYAGTAQFRARITPGVLDNAQIPTLQSVVPGPWFASSQILTAGARTSIGVTVASLVNPSGTMKIEMVDPLNRRLTDYDSTQPDTRCTTYSQLYCDFDFFSAPMLGTYQVVVWPGTPRREDANISVAWVSDLELAGRDATFSINSAGQNARLNVDVQSGEMLKLVLTRQTTGYPATDIAVYLFDPLGNRIGSTSLWYGSNSMTWNLPSFAISGTYSLVMDSRYGTPATLRAQLIAQ